MRSSFQQELEQLRLQVEVMAARVGVALERMHEVLRTGDVEVADAAVAADDQVDAMFVSLTERIYDLIRRESPVASDLRYLVSVLRILEELERIADLSLRVVKHATEHRTADDLLEQMATLDEEMFRAALDAWSAQDPDLAAGMASRSAAIDHTWRSVLDRARRLAGADAVAMTLMGQALERIADHTVIVGDRLRYLLTGDPAYIASEVR